MYFINIEEESTDSAISATYWNWNPPPLMGRRSQGPLLFWLGHFSHGGRKQQVIENLTLKECKTILFGRFMVSAVFSRCILHQELLRQRPEVTKRVSKSKMGLYSQRLWVYIVRDSMIHSIALLACVCFMKRIFIRP